jgi:hypothetical protein
MGEMRNAYKVIGRPRHKWEDNIRTDLKKIGGKVWTGSMWLRIGTSGRLL